MRQRCNSDAHQSFLMQKLWLCQQFGGQRRRAAQTGQHCVKLLCKTDVVKGNLWGMSAFLFYQIVLAERARHTLILMAFLCAACPTDKQVSFTVNMFPIKQDSVRRNLPLPAGKKFKLRCSAFSLLWCDRHCVPRISEVLTAGGSDIQPGQLWSPSP